MNESTYQITNLKQVYGNRTILDIPSLAIRPGEVFGLVGPSGAGKSTLLRLLALLEAPTEGAVQLVLGDGGFYDYETITTDTRRQLAMVFQRPVLLNRSVVANITYGLRVRGIRDAAESVQEQVARVRLVGFEDALPNTLSGGEMQRVALARALVLQPRVLLLDEPTANLDPPNVQLIEALIREQNQQHGTTIVLVTHNVFQARRLAHRVGLLLEGHLVEVASSAEFFEMPQDPRTAAFVRGEMVY
jgi:tungstate transport system ATP-binding protein